MNVDNFQPMLCFSATENEVEEGAFPKEEWVAQRKCDGIRAYVKKKRLYDRRGKDITEKFPEFKDFVSRVSDVVVLDGEIVAESGVFEDMSGRVHLKDKLFVKLSARDTPCRFVIFDIVGEHLSHLKLDARLNVLEKEHELSASEFKHNVRIASSLPAREMLAFARMYGWEGIVVKNRKSLYQGKRSRDWIKVKLFKEVEHTFTKIEEHPKGVTLEDSDGRRVVVNGQQANEVRRLMSKNGKVVADIQYLPQKKSKAWRFPSFRGVVKEEQE